MKRKALLIALPALLTIAVVGTGFSMIVINNNVGKSVVAQPLDFTIESAINNSSLTFKKNEEYSSLSIIPKESIGVADPDGQTTGGEHAMKEDLVDGLLLIGENSTLGNTNLTNFKSACVGFDYTYLLTSYVSESDIKFKDVSDATTNDDAKCSKLPTLNNIAFYPTDIELSLTVTVPIKNAVNIYIINKTNTKDASGVNNTNIKELKGDASKTSTVTSEQADTSSLQWKTGTDANKFDVTMSLDNGIGNDLNRVTDTSVTPNLTSESHVVLDKNNYNPNTTSREAKMKSFVYDMYDQEKLFNQNASDSKTEIKGFLGGFMILPNAKFANNTAFQNAVGSDVRDYHINIEINSIDLKYKRQASASTGDSVAWTDVATDGSYQLYSSDATWVPGQISRPTDSSSN